MSICYTDLMTDTVIKIKVEGIAAGGSAVARHEGKNIFIEGAAPGETVVCRITEDRRSWARAELLEITEASSARVSPACVYYGICGGCNLQHISYQSQIAAKTAILKDAFLRIGGIVPPEPKVFPSKPWEYRNRMQLHCVKQPPPVMRHRSIRKTKETSQLRYGLKAGKSDEIVPVSDCPVADPGIRNFLKEKGNNSFLPPVEKDRFTVYARNGLFLSEGGVRREKIRLLNREIVMDAGVFFQSNSVMLETLITDLREIAAGISGTQNFTAADLYCGVGTFAVFLSEFFSRVDLIEENKTALALARENFLSVSASAEFHAQRGEDWIKGPQLKNTGLRRYGFIVADPPRQGLSPAVSGWIASNGPPYFSYVSCDPATLARDSKILTEGGYRLAQLRLYDFYPQTAHIESLALFVR